MKKLEKDDVNQKQQMMDEIQMRKDNEERAAYFAKLKKYDTEHAKRQQWYQKYIDQQV